MNDTNLKMSPDLIWGCDRSGATTLDPMLSAANFAIVTLL